MGLILIVDDEPVTQLMLKLMLQRDNHTVLIASDGEDAISQLKNESVDLVITDVNMPNMDGMTLLQNLRQNERFQNLPILMFTAVGKRELHHEAKQRGATSLLTKPISSGELIEIVDQHLGLASA